MRAVYGFTLGVLLLVAGCASTPAKPAGPAPEYEDPPAPRSMSQGEAGAAAAPVTGDGGLQPAS